MKEYIHVHTPCPAGWGFNARLTVKLGRLAVETGLFDLYEIVPGCALSLLAILIFSLIDRNPGSEIQSEFEQMERSVE